MKQQKTICIIPARGGSKRLPNKNSIVFNGKPLLVHSIEYALDNTQIIDTVVVSTDSAELAAIAKTAGAQVINRPPDLATDHASTAAVMEHAIKTIGQEYDHVVLLQPTNPLRPKLLLKQAFVHYLEEKADSLMTVSRNKDKLGTIVNNRFIPYNYAMGQRSQDLEPLYSENGLLYITQSNLIAQGIILGAANLPYIVDHPYASVDIDTLEDLKYANFIFETTNS